MTNRDVDLYAANLRDRGVDLEARRILISILVGSEQEPDLSEPVVAEGIGRIRHFRMESSPGWPRNPLPMLPASRALGFASVPPTMRALVYQNAICNWRCWYCYVPFNLLAANPAHSRWATCDELVALYAEISEPIRPSVIDLSGGQPDLVPEWTVWMLDALEQAGLGNPVYLWSDDNLSNDYLFRYLTDSDIARLADAPNYGRVCCLKGFDSASFAFNTAAPPELFDRQFELLGRLWRTGIDTYCYATFTTPHIPRDPLGSMRLFVDRLQQIDEHLPLKVVPLEIRLFGPVEPRIRPTHQAAIVNQQRMVELWLQVQSERFASVDTGSGGDIYTPFGRADNGP